MLASLSVLTSRETCLPAVAALFIIKLGMFQCRTYNLAFDKAWAQCCQPSLCNWNAFSALLQRKRSFLWSQISPGFQELMQVMAWFCQAVKKWLESTAFNSSIWTGLGSAPPVFRCEGGTSCAGHLAVPLAPMETGILPIYKLCHSSSYIPQNLLKAGEKGRLIKKPYLPAATTALGRREPFLKQLWTGKGC